MADGDTTGLPKSIANRAGSSSMTCPRCEGATGVYNSRPTDYPVRGIIRRRACVTCGHRFTTREVPEEWLDAPAPKDDADLRVIEDTLNDVIAFVRSARFRA